MKKKLHILLAVFCIIAITCQVPIGAISVSSIKTEQSLSLEQPYVEDVSLRSAQAKHFQYSTGAYVAAIYTDPVHYQDKHGVWQEIDNTLVQKQDDSQAYSLNSSDITYYENTANDFKVRLPAIFKNDACVQVNYKDNSLSFRPLGNTNLSVASIDERIDVQDEKESLLAQAGGAVTAVEQFELLEESATLVTNQISSLTYSNVFSGIDLAYQLNGQKLKESIVLTEPTEQDSFSFELFYDGLTPIVQEHGAVHFYSETQDDPLFIIDAPYMEDSGDDDDLSMDVAVSVQLTDDGCIYTITPDSEWLQSSDRVYPILIDPTLTTSTTAADIEDNGVNASNPTTNYMTVDRMYVGSNVSGSKAYESRIYIRFPRISEIPTTAYIHKATMYLNHYSTTSYQSADNNTIRVYDAGGNNWVSSSITWNTQKSYSFSRMVVEQTINSPATDTQDEYVITDLVRDWYSTSATNNGVVLKPSQVYTDKTNRVCYYSSDCDINNKTKRPRVTIEYFIGEETDGITSGGVYFLRSKYSNKYIEVPNSGGSGTVLVQNSLTGDDNQRWSVAHIGGGVYQIIPMHNTTLRLDVINANDQNGQDVQVYNTNGNSAQLYRIVKNSDGTYCIYAALKSGTRVLDIEGPSTENGAAIQIWTYDSTADQMKWYFDVWPIAAKPAIYSRSTWNARSPITNQYDARTREAQRIIFHHSANKFSSTNTNDVIAEIQRIQNLHMDVEEWEDIAYNFIIDPAGRIWTGHTLSYKGAHAYGYNDDIGVLILGDFEPRALNLWEPNVLNAAQKNAMESLSKWLCYEYELSRINTGPLYAPISTHRTLMDTECPGDAGDWIENNLRAIIQDWGG